MSAELHETAAAPLGKRTRYPLNWRQAGTQSRCGLFGEEKNFFPLTGFKPRTIEHHSIVAMLTALIRLTQLNYCTKYFGKSLEDGKTQ